RTAIPTAVPARVAAAAVVRAMRAGALVRMLMGSAPECGIPGGNRVSGGVRRCVPAMRQLSRRGAAVYVRQEAEPQGECGGPPIGGRRRGGTRNGSDRGAQYGSNRMWARGVPAATRRSTVASTILGEPH